MNLKLLLLLYKKNLIIQCLLLMNSINFILLSKQKFPVITTYNEYEYKKEAVFTVFKVITSPEEYLFSFSLFIIGLFFLVFLIIRAIDFLFLYWRKSGFITRFALFSWNLSILTTTFYITFEFMALEGLLVLTIIFLITHTVQSLA